MELGFVHARFHVAYFCLGWYRTLRLGNLLKNNLISELSNTRVCCRYIFQIYMYISYRRLVLLPLHAHRTMAHARLLVTNLGIRSIRLKQLRRHIYFPSVPLRCKSIIYSRVIVLGSYVISIIVSAQSSLYSVVHL